MFQKLPAYATRLLGATALCCIAMSQAHAQLAGTLYGFGDSLTDNGNLPKYLGIDYPAPPYYKNHFSNGPVWLEYLPGFTGLSFSPGNDYAVGGAYAATGSLLGNSIPGVQVQIAAAAAAGLRFKPDDFVSIWAGANNYFGLLESLPQNAALSDPLVQSTIQFVARAVTNDVSTVIGLGARNLIVFNVPNLGVTPAYLGSAQSALASGIAAEHDAILPGEIATLQKQTGVNIYYINANEGLQEVLTDPGRFGIVNTTNECILTPSCVNGPRSVQDTYLFWDDVHPTTGVHEYLAEIVANQLLAEQTVGGQAQLLLSQQADFTSGIFQRLDARRGADANVGQLEVWMQGHYSHGDRDNQPGSDGFNYNTGSLLVGADYAIAPELLVGGAFGYGAPHADFDNSLGKLAYDAYQGGLYASWRQDGFFADATATYGGFDSSTAWRAGVLGSGNVNFTPNGDAYGAAVGGGYMITTGPVIVGPIVGLNYTRANIDSYTENGEPLITQHVDSQGVDSLTGRVGFSATYGAGLAAWVPRPTLSLSAEREFMNGSRTIDSYFLSANLPIHTTIAGYGATYGRAGLGVTEAFSNRLTGLVDLETTFGAGYGSDQSVLAKITAAF
jgi:outer membrane lipase/esterase